MRRIAIIDVGSNTAKLVDFAYEPGRSYRQVDELRTVVRLSQGMGDAGLLRSEPFERGLSALRTFASYCRATEVDDVVATATSAVRAASNGERFVAAVLEHTGIDLRVLSGEEEARTGALAAANAFSTGEAVVLDVGGGSVQLSRLAHRRFAAGASWPLGAVRSTETVLRGDPPKAKSVKALAAAAKSAFVPWFDSHVADGPLPMIGMGGTLRNLANVEQARSSYPLDLLHGYRLSRDALASLTEELLSLSAAKRADLPGLNRDRADIIAAGAVVIGEALAASGTDAIDVSGQGLREGLLYPYLVPGGEHLLDDVKAFSIRNLMRQYHDHSAHNEHVRALAWRLFDALASVDSLASAHALDSDARALLGHAALVHDIGMAVDYYRHEHHGFRLAIGRALPGFTHREQVMVALLVRNHRKGQIDDGGLGSLLADGDMETVKVLSGLLRVAEYLDRGKAQRITSLLVHVGDGVVQIEAQADGDARVEVHAAKLRADLLAAALTMDVEVVAGTSETTTHRATGEASG
ncbi:MAG: Ppx/GppA family phosphatase [Trueperaceae bacterium]|nr:Ppx/GppA family phosphatase [Trueperaceae bacterium]